MGRVSMILLGWAENRGRLGARQAWTAGAALLLLLASGWPGGVLKAQESAALKDALALEQAFVHAIERAEPAVVSIAVKDLRWVGPDVGFGDRRFQQFPEVPGQSPFSESDPQSAEFLPDRFGSGVIVRPDGLILTNYHVVEHDGGEKPQDEEPEAAIPPEAPRPLDQSRFPAEAPRPFDQSRFPAYRIYVSLSDHRLFQAEIYAADPRSDLAVLRLVNSEGQPARGLQLPTIPLGDASTLKKGQLVLALGNPYAIARDGSPSVSWGIISNMGRKAPPGPELDQNNDPARTTLHHFGMLIQTDARLNLGTSGGALINLQGEMIGLTTAIAALAGYEQSAGYAIPIDATTRRIIETLKQGREVEYGFLGVQPGKVSFSTVEQLALDQPGAAMVQHVYAGTPAHRFGLRPGDVILAIDGSPIVDADQLMLTVGLLPVGAEVRLTVRRGDEELQLPVTLAKFPLSDEQRARVVVTNPPQQWRGMQVDHATAWPILVTQEAIPPDGAVLVTDVQPDSPAARAGITPATFITHVSGQPVRTPVEFWRAVQRNDDQPVELRTPSGGVMRVDPS